MCTWELNVTTDSINVHNHIINIFIKHMNCALIIYVGAISPTYLLKFSNDRTNTYNNKLNILINNMNYALIMPTTFSSSKSFFSISAEVPWGRNNVFAG